MPQSFLKKIILKGHHHFADALDVVNVCGILSFYSKW
jgi:hypothetical protein